MHILCGNKMPTRCSRGFYRRSYCLLNMFRAPLCPSSGAQEYQTVVAACGISCCGFQVASLVWSWGLCVWFAGCCTPRSGWGIALQARRSRVRFPMVSLEFVTDTILPATLWPLRSTQPLTDEYQEYFLGALNGRCLGLTTLPPSCPDCLEIWELQTPGILRASPACNGIALLLKQ